jgi:hypothetical protein
MLLPHPLTEGQDHWLARNRCRFRHAGDADVAQVLQKDGRSRQDSRPLDWAELRTSALTEMTGESSKREIVELLQRQAASVEPIDQVLRRSNMSASDLHNVTALLQRLSKTVEQRTSRSISERLNAPAGHEEL